MIAKNSLTNKIVLGMLIVMLGLMSTVPGEAQRGGRGGFNQPDPNLPENPTAVSVATISSVVTGPGTMYESVQSLPPGYGLDHFDYEAKEYFVSGTAAGEPYNTRIVVRKPADDADFSGLVIAEAMHPSGSAHMFEYSSTYIMDSGHAALEVVTGGLSLLTGHNEARYEGINVAGNQVSEILAQVGAMIKHDGNDSPLSGLEVRNMILAGTSATAGILIRYLPGHMVYRTPDMERIYDGFMPTSNGSAIQQVDVPLIHVPTMTETAGGATPIRQDSDEPGNQYRVFEFAGMAHVDTRDSVRFKPDPCRYPISTFPLQAYMAVALHHLFEWVDNGTIPPRAPRILVDRDVSNDGSLMALDEHGNAIGGIRNPYVDVPTAKLGVRNEGANPLISNPGAYIAAGGLPAANQMCGLGGYQMAMSHDQLNEMYGDNASYQSMVRERTEELEREGWSLPVYRDMIMADAANVDF